MLFLTVIGLVDALLLWQGARYRAEAARLQAGMADLTRSRNAAVASAQADSAALVRALMRRRSAADEALHLTVSIDSSYVALDRGGDRLRRFKAEIGATRRVGVVPDTLHVAVPRGVRTVERLLLGDGGTALPSWIWRDRGLSAPLGPADSRWLGRDAIVTAGGTFIYSLPETGPLSDSLYVMPGSVRVPANDLAAIRESLSLGMRVYFH